tara:strand:- start:149 stop:829 length:681 start_codon:yes stop_codon:yes gene_type:complete
MGRTLESNLTGVKSYVTALEERGFLSVTHANVNSYDCTKGRVEDGIPDGGFDMILTSPPYGDSRTTVAYEEFSWLTNVWLGLDTRASGKLGREMMGGDTSDEIVRLGHRGIDSAISRMDEKRAKKNYAFYRDYLDSIVNVSSSVAKGGHVCYIVGNRTSGGQRMRQDLFTRWAFERNGFRRVGEIKKRAVSNTRMPKQIAITGKNTKKSKVRTMNKEYIVVCEKMV